MKNDLGYILFAMAHAESKDDKKSADYWRKKATEISMANLKYELIAEILEHTNYIIDNSMPFEEVVEIYNQFFGGLCGEEKPD